MQTMYVKSGDEYRQATEPEVAEVAGHYALIALNRQRPTIDDPYTAVVHLKRMFAGRDYEAFAVMLLNTRYQLIECVELFRGTINQSAVHPREVIKEVLWRGAAAVMFAHNHPSGSVEPSEADIALTQRLTSALDFIDVGVLDHLIIGGTGEWSSLRQNGLM